jgi:hypothetical protein
MNIQPPSHPPREISVTEPVSHAYEHMKRMLFQPFDLGKWFAIGFCAWLAGLGESGGSGGNFGNFNSFNHQAQPLAEIRHYYELAQVYVLANLTWLVPVVSAVLVLMLSLGVLILWLNSRGKFMFLHCVALNRAEIDLPWEKYARAANRLFGFRLLASGNIDFFRVMPSVGFGLGLCLLILLFALIHKFMVDFVVPIMYLRGGTCRDAWGEFLRLLADHAGYFLLYLLFQLVLSIGLGTLVVTLVLLTCCTAGCLMMIPYVGTVLLLPILIFKRSYSLCFLAQFGPSYNVFPPPAPPVATPPPGLQPL